MPPLSAHYFEANMRRGCLLKYSIRPVHTPLPLFLTIYVGGWQSQRQLRWTCTTWNQRHSCVFSRWIRATCIVSGDRKPPWVNSRSWCKQCKPLWWPANKAIVHVFNVYVFLNTNNDRAELKAHKIMPRRCSFTQELGVKEVGGCLLEGNIFLGSYRICITKYIWAPPLLNDT